MKTIKFFITISMVILTFSNLFSQARRFCRDDISIIPFDSVGLCLFQPVQSVWVDDPFDNDLVRLDWNPNTCDCSTLKMILEKPTLLFGTLQVSGTLWRNVINIPVYNYFTVQKTVRAKFTIVEESNRQIFISNPVNVPAATPGSPCNIPGLGTISIPTPIGQDQLNGPQYFTFQGGQGVRHIKMELVDANGDPVDGFTDNNIHILKCDIKLSQKIPVVVVPFIFRDINYPAKKFVNGGPWAINIRNYMQFVYDMFPVPFTDANLNNNVYIDVEKIPVAQTSIYQNLQDMTLDLGKLEKYKKNTESLTPYRKIIAMVDYGYLSPWVSAAGGSAPKKGVKGALVVDWNIGQGKTIAHEMFHIFTNANHENPPGNAAYGYYVRKLRYKDQDLTPPMNCFFGAGYPLDDNLRWVDKFDYKFLIGILTSPGFADPEVVNIAGRISRQNNTCTLDPFYKFLSNEIDVDSLVPVGRYLVRFKDNLNTVIKQYGFNVGFSFWDIDNEESPIGVFNLNIPTRAGIRKIEICDSLGSVLAIRNISNNPPNTDIIYPTSGQVFPNDSVYIGWNSSDVDNDTLYHIIKYSNDNGATWFPVEVDVKGNHYNWRSNWITPGSNYKIKILTTDGYNTSVDSTNGTFTIAYHDSGPNLINAPTANIGIPSPTIAPKATFKNFGTINETNISVTFKITGPVNYTSNKTISSLAPGATIQVTFDSTFNPALGTYYITAYSSLPTDQNRANDTLKSSFTVYPNINNTFTGNAAGDWLGYSVASAGDVNGDGFDDIIIGAPNSNNGTGKAYIYYGGQNMNNIPDVIMTGENVNNHFGISVSSAGDVNNDGYDDVIAGAYGYWNTNTGRAYIFLGGPNMDNIPDDTLTGEAPNNFFGYSVSTAGDINYDGYSDVIVGAYGYWNTYTGRAYIYYGGTNMDNVADVIMTGEHPNNNFGISVSTAGDVNGDGISDVIIGADGYYNTNTGRAYIYYGGNLTMDNTPDVIKTGFSTGDRFGVSVSTASDVNGDGYSDVIIGAILNDVGGNDAGRAYIYFGNSSMNTTDNYITLTGHTANGHFGLVSSAGDFNGDGFSEVIVGAFAYNSSSYIYFGGTNMDTTYDVKLNGENPNDYFGNSCSTAEDVNGDGISDVIVGAHFNNGGGSHAGRAYLYLGSSSLITLNLTAQIEGLSNGSTMLPDTASVYLRNTSSPYNVVDYAKSILNVNGNGTFKFNNAVNGTSYYIVVKHRNSIETWSKTGQAFSSGTLTYDFTTAANKAYGDNLVLKGTKWCIYSGDINHDGSIDLTDITLVYNDASNFLTGYNVTDVTGDNITDLMDLIITFNNSSNFVQKITPSGTGPMSPNSSYDTKNNQVQVEQPKKIYKDKINIHKNKK